MVKPPGREILIVRPAALGDTLMLAPALAQMRGPCTVTLVGRRPGIHYLGSLAHRSLDFEGMGWHTIFTDRPEMRGLPRVDIAAVFLRDVDGRLGRNLPLLFPDAEVHVFPGLPEKGEGVHAALHLARCLRAAGCTQVDPEEAVAQALRSPLLGVWSRGERVVFHPGSGGAEKNHPPWSWLELIENLSSHSRGDPLITILLGPAEEGLVDFFEGRLSRIRHELVFSPAPERLLSILGEGALYLGQDSGVTHLSAMLGVPTIALFRSSSVRMWRPLGPRVSVIEERGDRIGVDVILKEAEYWLRKK